MLNINQTYRDTLHIVNYYIFLNFCHSLNNFALRMINEYLETVSLCNISTYSVY